MTSKIPSLELMPFAQKDDATPAVHPLGDIALPPFVVAGNAAEQEVTSLDKYLDAATVEFEEGNIDQPLWDRAIAQAKGDRESAVPLYLRARATALRVRKRDLRTERRTRTPRVTGNTTAESAIPGGTGRIKAADDERRGTKLSANYGMAMAATCAGVVSCALLLYVYLGRPAPQEPVVAASVAPVDRASPSVRAGNAVSTNKNASDTGTNKRPSAELIARIDELRLADNWNVLVLYATEWTRLEPGNAAAWNQLSIGFEKLKQFDDAYNAATKAVNLAPSESLYWRNLGQLDLELSLPTEALHAFEAAAALNDKDIYSLVQVGLLNLRLARVPEAKLALDKALAAGPEDAEVLCLKTLVARPPIATNESPAAAKPRESFSGSCRDFAERKDPAVVATSTAASKSAAIPRKR